MEGDQESSDGEKSFEQPAASGQRATDSVESVTENSPIGKPQKTAQNSVSQYAGVQPSDFDRSLQNTDRTIRRFTIVSGVAAAFSAGAAIYTATTLRGSSIQVDDAIKKIGDGAVAARAEAKALNGQLTLMQEQIKAADAQASAATKSARALSIQAKITRDSEQRSLRAYVDLDTDQPFVLKENPGPQGLPFILFRMRNSGQTPANNIGVKVSYDITKPDYGGTKKIKLPERPIYSTGTIPAQGTIDFSRTISLDPNIPILQVRAGRFIYLAHGTITYTDIFKSKHKTTFCIYWGDHLTQNICNQHNHAN